MAARSGKRRELVESEILECAAELFASQGFGATSLQDIADSMSISRPALYHYIGSKDELLVRLAEGVTVKIANDLEEISYHSSPAPVRLELAIQRLASSMIQQPVLFRLLERSQHECPPALAEQDRKARQRARDAIVRIVAEGVDEGNFDICEPRVVAFAIIGMTNWIAWWIHSADDLAPDLIIGTMRQLVLRGIVQPGQTTEVNSTLGTGTSMARILHALKLDVARLESLLAAEDHTPDDVPGQGSAERAPRSRQSRRAR